MEFTKNQVRKLSATIRNTIQRLDSDKTLRKNGKKLSVKFLLRIAHPGESEGGMYPELTEALLESARMRAIKRVIDEFKQLCGKHGIRINYKEMREVYPFCAAVVPMSKLLSLLEEDEYLITRVISREYNDIRDEME